MTAQIHPNHHPCCNTLLRYAAGTLSPTMHMFMATHLSFCPQCRQELQAYESQAGLGLENLPPEELDVSCLNNLLSKIDESGPIACIDVTIPIDAAPAYRYPEPLQMITGATGDRIRWTLSDGYASWALPPDAASAAFIYKVSAKHTLADIAFDKNAVVLILNGGFDDANHHYHQGDIVKPKQAMRSITHAETLCLVITPAKEDKPTLLQCLMSFISGDKT
jgi:putative transcriptional regulator